jgi:hypothetical protein
VSARTGRTLVASAVANAGMQNARVILHGTEGMGRVLNLEPDTGPEQADHADHADHAADVADETALGRRTKRPLFERLGMAAVAAVVALLFGGVAIASWTGGEPFLAAMAGLGSLMTAWAGANTLFRG